MLYAVAAISKQGYFQYLKRKQKEETKEILLLERVKQVRLKHKRMGSRPLFYKLQISEMGINQFERLVASAGLGVKIKRKWIRTTAGYYEETDQNLVMGLRITDINQVVVGDITYLILAAKTYYIFTLKDAYSKRIVGLYGSDNMQKENAIKVLRQWITLRGIEYLRGAIHHTDAGAQYKSLTYKRMLKDRGIRMSIAENCLENGMAEQLNSTLKNDYLFADGIKDVNDLNRKLKRIKKLINEERPVEALHYLTPVAFEEKLKAMPVAEKPVFVFSDFASAKSEKRGTLRRHKATKKV